MQVNGGWGCARVSEHGHDNLTHGGAPPEPEHPSTLLGAYALGALDADEAAAVRRHLDACPDCRVELVGYETVTDLLPWGAEPRPAPLRARAGLLARVAELGANPPEHLVLLAAPPRPPRRVRVRVLSARRAWLAVVPAAVLALALGINALFMQDRIQQQQNQIQTLEDDKGKITQALLVDSAARYVSELTGTGAAPQARARLFLDREANYGVLLAINLREPDEGQGYVAWLHGNGVWERLGELTLDKQGRSQMAITPRNSIDDYDSFVITIEADPSVAAPAGPAILSGATVPQSSRVHDLAVVP